MRAQSAKKERKERHPPLYFLIRRLTDVFFSKSPWDITLPGQPGAARGDIHHHPTT